MLIGDHGPPFSRGKTTVYELGTKIPFIARGPGVKEGQSREELVSTIDLLPSFLRAAGAPKQKGVPGMPLQPLFADDDVEWRMFLATEFNAHAPDAFSPQRAIRDHRFKLIKNYLLERRKPGVGVDGCVFGSEVRKERWRSSAAYERLGPTFSAPAYEFYDLKNDPLEANNLYGNDKYEKQFQDLKRQLNLWQRETNDWALDSSYLDGIVGYHDRWNAFVKEAAKNLQETPLSAPCNRINSSPFQGSWEQKETN